ncbi:MAG: transcriptional regulator [Gammaproteobacteria bacterium]
MPVAELIPVEGDGAGQKTKDRLLLLLKTRGPLTTRALADALDISVPAVRQHLKSLGEAVTSGSASNGVGRPSRCWSLTDEAQARFPDTHSELTVRILESITRALGDEALDAVIADRYRASEARYREAIGARKTLPGRLKRLVALRSEEGYMAELEKTAEGWLLLENHCPICAAASYCQGFCRNELALFQSVLGDGVRVSRIEYLLEGGRRCAYRITRI